MAPPPRPPIICYDLQTNSNARRVPDPRYCVPLVGGTARKTKVTVVQRDANEFNTAKAEACWLRNSYHDKREQSTGSENIPIRSRNTRLSERTNSHTPHDKVVRVSSRSCSKNQNLLESKPYQFNTQPFAGSGHKSESNKLNTVNARHAYSQKLRSEAEEKERRLERKRQHLAMQAQLDEILAQLESSKRVHENLLKTFGMSHNAAKYIHQQDEDFAKLRKKVDQFAETRSKELGRRVQQMKRYQEIQMNQDKKVEERRLRDMSITTHSKHKNWNSTLNNSLSSNSQTTNTATTNTASPSSTISISSCSSPMSTDEQLPSIDYINPPTYKSTARSTLPTPTILSSSTPSKNRNHDSRRCSTFSTRPKERFSFYKGNPSEQNATLEVTDIDFFDKVEDKTMIEVNELFNKMQSVLRDFNHELQ